eukprot:TRINITY_DN62131_c0_g1_i1.p1 TRINITY_DN62131_c0_g1~~TRINITY_DN62131_c0_g1_i1.p1  ORF type:complete len:358 (+),score=77.39 TRINITY_DN62131_c0_g1_i1:101-1174(+)
MAVTAGLPPRASSARSAVDRRLAFNDGVRVPGLSFDRVSSREQRSRAGYPGRMNTALLDAFYDVNSRPTERRPPALRFSPARKRKGRDIGRLNFTGGFNGMDPLCSNDLCYQVNWASQQPQLKGAVRFERAVVSSPDRLYPFRNTRTVSSRLTEGTLGGVYPVPDERHTACVSIARHTDRQKASRAGFTDRDPMCEEWYRQQRPLNVKYSAVEPRSHRFPAFHRQSSRHADGPFSGSIRGGSSECYTDVDDREGDVLSDTEAADMHRSFAAVKRKLGRSVPFAPSADDAIYAHAQRPVSRLQCGHFTEAESTALFPAPTVQPHRWRPRAAAKRDGARAWSSQDSESERRQSTASFGF